MRLIDANELKKQMCFKCNDEYDDEPCDQIDCVFCNAINDAPTIDAVPVVRCEYCNKGHPELGMNGCVWCARYGRDMNTDDFCSYGERKEGDD